MAHFLHHRAARADYRGRHHFGHRCRARLVVFAGQQRHLAMPGINLLDVFAGIPITWTGRMSSVDGSRVARGKLTLWRGRVQSSVRPVDAVS
jgi:hypothetical protein